MDQPETITSNDGETAADPVTIADPIDGEVGDKLVLVKTGHARIYLAGQLTGRLARPTFGQLRKLRLAHEAMISEVSDVTAEMTVEGEDLQAEVTKVLSDDEMTKAKKQQAISRLRKRDREGGAKITEATEAGLIAWWGTVLDVLAAGGRPESFPDDWPGWIVDGSLPGKLLAHWRSAPLGRG